jgi:hypothetical protein
MACDRPVAWVGEESGWDEHYRPVAIGLFSAHVDDDDLAEGYENGPRGVQVQEALGWARSRAERVVVRYFAREGQQVRLLGGYAAAAAVCRATAHLASRRPRPALATDAWA